MDTPRRSYENISALADGELALAEIELAVAMLATPDGQAAWKTYYQIGAALRSERCGSDLSTRFTASLAARLDAESSMNQAPQTIAPDAVSSLP
jgi:sigma-E factor negative regulatory protein RseA